jgi:hypothetical protein
LFSFHRKPKRDDLFPAPGGRHALNGKTGAADREPLMT